MGILNTTQIKTLKRMLKYVGEMSEATADLYNDCVKISANFVLIPVYNGSWEVTLSVDFSTQE